MKTGKWGETQGNHIELVAVDCFNDKAPGENVTQAQLQILKRV
jgi:hypothetical protein